ncbi:DegT/DnrJ/EryC1/StrS family aminotransferase, partial [Patescibacteria group bacterium]|nr:DegT/DnrJ/EryC1/StrS family aminotransferase [Patescibacteria group bacterium]
MIALDIKEGDEVIVPSFSFIATANAPLFVGAKPVFADIDEITYGLDIEDVKRKITEKTKAIMLMHYGGAVCGDIEKLSVLCKEKNIYLIEDTAESFGAKLNNQKAGTFGTAGMFSFCQTKVFTTGEGGCVVTNSKELADKVRLIGDHGREGKEYTQLGYCWRMPDCLAALGISQLEKVDKLIAIRREKADYYRKQLEGAGDIFIPVFPEEMFHVYQEIHIRTKSRDALKEFLTERGIGTRISFPPIHKSKYYAETLGYDVSLPNTEKITSETLTLPLYPNLTQEEQDYVINSIKAFYASHPERS